MPRQAMIVMALAVLPVAYAEWTFRDFLVGDWDMERQSPGTHAQPILLKCTTRLLQKRFAHCVPFAWCAAQAKWTMRTTR